MYQQFLPALPSEYFQTTNVFRHLPATTLDQATHHLLPGLLPWSPNCFILALYYLINRTEKWIILEPKLDHVTLLSAPQWLPI